VPDKPFVVLTPEYFEDYRSLIPQFSGKQPLQNLLTWNVPSRVFKQHDREFLTTVGSIIFLLCVILVFIKEIQDIRI